MLINSLIHFTLLIFRLSVLVSVFLHLVLFFQLHEYCLVETNVFIHIWNNTFLHTYLFFCSLTWNDCSNIFMLCLKAMYSTYLLQKWILLSIFIYFHCFPLFILSVVLIYISFLCYSCIGKSMAHFYSEDFLFCNTRKIRYSSCWSLSYLRITSASNKWTKYITIMFLLFCTI